MTFLDKLKQLLGGRPGNTEMISCEEALAVIQEFLDGELDHLSSDRVRAHFEVCQRCYPHLRLEEAFRAAVRKATRGESAPPELKTHILAMLAEASEA